MYKMLQFVLKFEQGSNYFEVSQIAMKKCIEVWKIVKSPECYS